MRPIDADALEARMYYEAFEKDSADQRWDSGCWIRYRLFEKALKEAPTVEERKTGKWIPCSERYPEENQICIVTDETMRNTYEYRFCKETYDENQGWTYLKHRIIAWMPLPEPYQEDKQ